MSVSKTRIISHDYQILISNIKINLRAGRVIEAYERLQELEQLNARNLKEK